MIKGFSKYANYFIKILSNLAYFNLKRIRFNQTF